MKTCATCSHFLKSPAAHDRGSEFVTGLCRAVPPSRDFNWHRVRAHDYCAYHSANTPHFATGSTGATSQEATPAAAIPTTDTAPAILQNRKRSRPARGELFPTT